MVVVSIISYQRYRRHSCRRRDL
ncbi:hypothetical protein [Chamaesiphon sp.]